MFLMAVPSPRNKPTSFLFGFSTKPFSTEPEPSIASPTSILRNPFCCPDPNPDPKRHCWERFDGVGLGIIDSLKPDPNTNTNPSPNTSSHDSVSTGSRMVLKIQIPNLVTKTETKTPQLGVSVDESLSVSTPVGGFCLSSDMELSEDYTCVIARGPVPKTTHIFDNCVVGVADGKKENEKGGGGFDCGTSFLSFCCTCKKSLGDGNDIYIYRGEKAFCSDECRCEEMKLEENMEKPWS